MDNLLLLHSAGAPLLWASLPAQPGRGSIAPVHLGYPPHPRLARGSAFDVAEDVAHVLAAIPNDGSAIDIVAHSYGGLVAAKLLPRLVGRIRSLFLFEPVLFGALVEDKTADPAAIQEARELSANRWFLDDPKRGGTEEWLELFVDYWNQPGWWRRMPEDLREWTREFGWKMYAEMRSSFSAPQTFDDLAVSVPITLAMGTRSPKTSRAMVKAIADRNSHAKTVELQGLGHMAPLSHPKLVHQAVVRHLEGVS